MWKAYNPIIFIKKKTMLKFIYYYLKSEDTSVEPNTLFIQKPASPRQPVKKTFTTNWGSPGFILEPANHWITFTLYPSKIRVFYKQVINVDSPPGSWPANLSWPRVVSSDTLTPFNQKITYYQKDLVISPQTISLTFTFTTQDEVEKVDGMWVKKHGKK